MGISGGLLRSVLQFGGGHIAQSLTKGYPRILMYHRFTAFDTDVHRVSSKQFEDQIKYLVRNYEVVPLDEAIDPRLKTNGRPRVSITVDDGYKDFYDVAYPILRKYGLPATLYVVSDFVDQKMWFWYDRLLWCLQTGELSAAKRHFEARGLKGVSAIESVSGLWALAVPYFLKLDGVSIEKELLMLQEKISVHLPCDAPTEYAAANWDELREMHENNITIGAHTVSHYSLGSLDREDVESEIAKCKSKIEKEMGAKVDHFCYPNGQPSDIPAEYEEILVRYGFKSSVVAFYDRFGLSDRYAIRRHGVGSDFYAFKKTVLGIDWLGAILLNRNSMFSWS